MNPSGWLADGSKHKTKKRPRNCLRGLDLAGTGLGLRGLASCEASRPASAASGRILRPLPRTALRAPASARLRISPFPRCFAPLRVSLARNPAGHKKTLRRAAFFMPRKGLEPSRLAALVPEYSAAIFVPHKELYRAAYGRLV